LLHAQRALYHDPAHWHGDSMSHHGTHCLRQESRGI
jgi:hypothetical protein